MTTVIEIHDGRDVIGAKMSLTNAGDGLSKAMALEPVRFSIGDRVLVLVDAVVAKEQYVPAINGDLNGPLHFVAVLKAEAAKITTLQAAQREMDKHKGRIDRAAQIPGQQSIQDEIRDGETAEAGDA